MAGAAATAGLGSGIMNIDVEFHIRHNYPWSKLPANVRQVRLRSARPRPAPPSLALRTVRGSPSPRRVERCPPDSPDYLGLQAR